MDILVGDLHGFRNRICWNVIIQLDDPAVEDEQFRGSDYAPETTQTFLDEIRHYKHLMTLWLHISTGQGAVNAMLDAIALANCHYDIKPTSFENIKLALKDYKEQRFDRVKEQYSLGTALDLEACSLAAFSRRLKSTMKSLSAHPKSNPLVCTWSVICLNSNILAALEQCNGIYQELLKVAKPSRSTGYYTSELKEIARMNSNNIDLLGYDWLMFARPELYTVLLARIPPHKLHMNKKLVSFEQDPHQGVTVHFSDNSTTQGDILVGADGAHSSVRQHLYNGLEKEGLLPKSDTETMNKGYISLLGTTDELDPAQYPGLTDFDSKGTFVIGDGSNPYTWVTYTIPGNKICWNVIIQLEAASAEDSEFRSADWASESSQKMMGEIRHFKLPHDKTLGDLFDKTPQGRVAKVFYEDKLFATWNHDRVVLIGDGQGAVNAMQDAVILANCIYDILPNTFTNVKEALNEFKDQRFDNVKAHYGYSQFSAKLIQLVFNWLPKSMQRKQVIKDSAYRPQANFMPQVPKRGTAPADPQRPSKRYQEEQRKAAAASVSAV
ncbi:hypothetical protein BGX23_007240 [Mortierella sp. AD031]|nr:hypothetical protein BGX23_007240 [Mortierella sp. AD031]